MRLRTVINLHQGLTAPVVGLLMLVNANTTTAAWVYLALHGTDGALWLIKDWLFPDRQWQRPVSGMEALLGFLILGVYWLAPWLLISSGAEAPAALLAGSWLGVFVPNRRRKDESLARHPEFAAWKDRTGLLLPKLIG